MARPDESGGGPPGPETPGSADRARLAELRQALASRRQEALYVGWAEAERICERLAAALLERYGAAELRRASTRPIPRGGLIVLGMLSYLLDLGEEALRPDPDPRRLLLIVDDCALSGARFGRELAAVANERVAFAHLCSTPELRRSILEREPRVECCVAGRDLEDRARRRFPDPETRAGWEQRWRRRLGAGRYWIGQPDLAGFAWSEPERPFWNPVTERVEHAWRFLPPERCLKHRGAPEVPPRPGAAPHWRPADGLVVGEVEGRTWLWNGDTDEVFRLEGIEADIWKAISLRGDEGAVVDYLAGRYKVGETRLRRDVEVFLARLVELGLLRAADAEGG